MWKVSDFSFSVSSFHHHLRRNQVRLVFTKSLLSTYLENYFTDRKIYSFLKNERHPHVQAHNLQCYKITTIIQIIFLLLFEGLCKFALFFIPSHLGSSAASWICKNSVIFHKKNTEKYSLDLDNLQNFISPQDFQLPYGCNFFWLSSVSSESLRVLNRWKAPVFAGILVSYIALQAIKICIKRGRNCSFTGDLPSIVFHSYVDGNWVHTRFSPLPLSTMLIDIYF